MTSTIAFEGEGRWREYEGGVSDWLLQSQRARQIAEAKGQKGAVPFHDERKTGGKVDATAAAVVSPAQKTRKLGFKEQRELDGLPDRIAALEAEQQEIAAQLADGSLFARDNGLALLLSARNAQIDEELLEALERWEALG